MTPKELREKTSAERAKLKKELVDEIFRLKMKQATGQLEKNHRFKEIRKDIARIFTIENASREQA